MLKRVWWLVIWGEVRMDHSIYIPLRYWAINRLFHEALHRTHVTHEVWKCWQRGSDAIYYLNTIEIQGHCIRKGLVGSLIIWGGSVFTFPLRLHQVSVTEDWTSCFVELVASLSSLTVYLIKLAWLQLCSFFTNDQEIEWGRPSWSQTCVNLSE